MCFWQALPERGSPGLAAHFTLTEGQGGTPTNRGTCSGETHMHTPTFTNSFGVRLSLARTADCLCSIVLRTLFLLFDEFSYNDSHSQAAFVSLFFRLHALFCILCLRYYRFVQHWMHLGQDSRTSRATHGVILGLAVYRNAPLFHRKPRRRTGIEGGVRGVSIPVRSRSPPTRPGSCEVRKTSLDHVADMWTVRVYYYIIPVLM